MALLSKARIRWYVECLWSHRDMVGKLDAVGECVAYIWSHAIVREESFRFTALKEASLH